MCVALAFLFSQLTAVPPLGLGSQLAPCSFGGKVTVFLKTRKIRNASPALTVCGDLLGFTVEQDGGPPAPFSASVLQSRCPPVSWQAAQGALETHGQAGLCAGSILDARWSKACWELWSQ